MHRVHSKIALLIPLFLLTLTCLSFSQGPSPPRQEGLTQEAIHQLLEGPQTALRGLKERGISFQAMLVYDWSKSLASETDAKGGFGRYSFDLLMPVDAEKLFGLKDSAGLLRFKHHMRHFGETYDEEAQVYSNIDANSRTTLYEIWLQKKFFSEHLRMKVGKIDANTEFATVSTAADFLNSSMGFSPTILVFPTYPEPKFGINVFLGRPSATYVLGAGIFRTVDATMSILEPARNWNSGPGEHGGRASFGYWRLDGKIDLTDGTRSPGTQGFYSVVEQSVWRQTAPSERGLSGFLQVGWADGRSSRITQHIGGGVVLQAPWSRHQDSAGTAATWVRFSSEPRADYDLRGELTVELYYKLTFTKHVAFVPDFQFLHHPGGRSANRDCPVVTPRLVISF